MGGARAEVTTRDDIILDFSALFTADSTTSKVQDNCLQKEPATQLLQYKKQREEYHAKCLSVYKKYQENILKSSQIQTEILKGAKVGEKETYKQCNKGS